MWAGLVNFYYYSKTYGRVSILLLLCQYLQTKIKWTAIALGFSEWFTDHNMLEDGKFCDLNTRQNNPLWLVQVEKFY